MSVFDDFFTPYEVKNRQEIERLAAQIDAGPSTMEIQRRLEAQNQRLELMVKALSELLVAKAVITRCELSVMLRQIDLADGVEDGRLRPKAKRNAPKCKHCRRFINPKRTHCVYCGQAVEASGDPYRDGSPRKPVRNATCARCNKTVPEEDTYFTGTGLACESCYDPATDA